MWLWDRVVVLVTVRGRGMGYGKGERMGESGKGPAVPLGGWERHLTINTATVILISNINN